MKSILAIIAVGGVVVLLQGCGEQESQGPLGTTGTTTRATTITTTTTTTLPSRTKPMTSQATADYLNNLYLAFDENDDSSDIGVTISMVANESSFFGNIFCSKFFNPTTRQFGGCFKGAADCTLSAAVLSHKWMIDPDSKALASFAGRRIGIVLNQTMVETKWGRCSYVWDGASWNLYNRGCGLGAPGMQCTPGEDNAFNNQCGDAGSKHTCTDQDDMVKQVKCTVVGGRTPVPPTHAGHPQCHFPGPAYNFHGQDDYNPGMDTMRTMAKQRVQYNNGSDAEGANLKKNNEVVVDVEIMIHDTWENPITAIPAILYTESNNDGDINRNFAIKVRDDLCKHFGCAQNGGGMIPIVKIDDTKYFPAGPFFADTSSEDLNMAATDVVKSDQANTPAKTDQASASWLNMTAMLIIVAIVGFCVAVGVMMNKKRAQKRDVQIGTNIEMLQGQMDL